LHFVCDRHERGTQWEVIDPNGNVIWPKPFLKKMENVCAFSNTELEKLPIVKKGDKIECFRCGKDHELLSGINPKTGADGTVLFYKCSGKTYLGAVDGRLVANKFKIS
jgi:hypothetical protein